MDPAVRRRHAAAAPELPNELDDDDAGLKARARATLASRLNRTDVAIVAVLLVVGLITRLWDIADPRSQMFDETHFTKFSTWYVTGHYFVDIHPPLAKLIFAWVLQARGFVGAEEEFVEWWVPNNFIGTKDWLLLYEPEWGNEYIPLRKTSAITGALLIVVGYLSARAMGCLRITSFLAACMFGMETLILLQSRQILCDVFLYFFDLATIGASFASVRPGLLRSQQLLWCGITGFCLGCCLSVKLTALGILALVGIHQLLCLFASEAVGKGWRAVAERGAVRAGIILGITAFVFFGLWTLHLNMLPYSGQGDGFMQPEFQSTLVQKTFPHKAKCPNHDYGKRWDCGKGGITPEKCVAKGCCWDPTSPKAWCYYTSDPSLNAPTDPDACPNHANTWSDCGKGGITPEACVAKGCCWDPTSPKAWCYHKGNVTRPVLSWWYNMGELLRATWANNHGALLKYHPSMSEWWEWPFMLGNSIPFGDTEVGGRLKAIGNPGVYWPVAACIIICTLASGVVAWSLWKGPRPLWAVWAGVLRGVNESGGGGWAIPFVTLLSGYYLNLVPYTLIERSKFVYHGVPALIVGILFTVFVSDVALRWSLAPTSTRSAYPFLTLLLQHRVNIARGLVLLLLALATAGFLYWGLPYAYGIRLTPEQHRARMWVRKWANHDAFIFPQGQ